MTTQLWWYSTNPGDPDHIEHSSFDEGLLRATPEKVAELVADVNNRRSDLLAIVPVESVEPADIARLRAIVGSAISAYHECDETETCPEDASYIAAW